jgi:hypothetical protein
MVVFFHGSVHRFLRFDSSVNVLSNSRLIVTFRRFVGVINSVVVGRFGFDEGL